LSDAVITALIMAGASVICQILINANNRKRRIAESAEEQKKKAIEDTRKEEQLESRLSRIEEKLDIHNGYASKLNNIEKSIAVIETKIEALA